MLLRALWRRTLVIEELPPANLDFVQAHGIRLVQIGVEGNKVLEKAGGLDTTEHVDDRTTERGLYFVVELRYRPSVRLTQPVHPLGVFPFFPCFLPFVFLDFMLGSPPLKKLRNFHLGIYCRCFARPCALPLSV